MNRTEEYIEHYGVPGMKWGVRKDRKKGRRKSTSEEASTLTNKELKKRVNRLEMEKKYVRLTEERGEQGKSKSRKAVGKGAGIVTSIVGNAAKQAVQEYAKSEMTKAIQNQTKKKVKKDIRKELNL